MDYLGVLVLVLIPTSKTHEQFKSDHAAGTTNAPAAAAALRYYLLWVGVESLQGCTPMIPAFCNTACWWV